jgi:hypothetical protein
MRWQRWKLAALVAASVVPGAVTNGQTVLFSENFDSLLPSLQSSVNERVGTAILTVEASTPGTTAIPGVWSATTPGWTTDNTLSTYDGSPTVTPGVPGTGLPAFGVDEWEGWRFANKNFWSEATGNQDRGLFGQTSGASGTVAIADADEYFDLGSQNDATNGGYFSTALNSPTFSVEAGGFYGLGFDSSWRPEAFDDAALGGTIVNLNNQAVEIIATFNNGSTQVVKWNSDPSDALHFKDDAPDQHIPSDGSQLFFEAPVGATEATLSFRLANAANDWWWAVDNIEVVDLIGAAGTVLFEDFEDTMLGDSVNERLGAGAKVTSAPGSATTILGTDYPTESYAEAFTHAAPSGWDRNTTIDAGNAGDNNIGVFEWEGWSFATPEFWTFADKQGREAFTNGTGIVAIADGDEWTDLGSPTGKMLTMLETPEIDLTGVDSGTQLVLSFDSGYRAEGGQSIAVIAYFDGDTASPLELLFRDGTSADGLNETLSLEFDPAGASTVRFAFEYEGGNNWWWAIDNIELATSVVPEPSTVALLVLGGAMLIGVRRKLG